MRKVVLSDWLSKPTQRTFSLCPKCFLPVVKLHNWDTSSGVWIFNRVWTYKRFGHYPHTKRRVTLKRSDSVVSACTYSMKRHRQTASLMLTRTQPKPWQHGFHAPVWDQVWRRVARRHMGVSHESLSHTHTNALRTQCFRRVWQKDFGCALSFHRCQMRIEVKLVGWLVWATRGLGVVRSGQTGRCCSPLVQRYHHK